MSTKLSDVDAARCRDALAKVNPGYAIAFDWMHDVLGYDCTAQQLSETLKRNHYSWAPSRRAAQRWKNEIKPVIAEFQSRPTPPLKHR